METDDRNEDRLIHGYFGISIRLIWGTIKTDIPPLITEIYQILDQKSEEPSDPLFSEIQD